MMHPPDELMIGSFLPSMRLLVSKKLRSKGHSQSRISSLLGITQASVSHYLSTSPDRAYSKLAELGLGRDEADRYAGLLAEDVQRDPVLATETLTLLWTGLLGRGLVCLAHRTMYPALATCDICLREFAHAQLAKQEAVDQVARAVRIIEASPTFARVIPEVSVNIVCVQEDSDSPDGVVAVPGRIVRVRNTARAMLPPEVGVSKHMANILVLVRRRVHEYHAAINLKYDLRMKGVLRKRRLRQIEIGGTYPTGTEDPTVAALARKLMETDDRFDVVVDLGGKGVEPNLYVFGKTAIEAASVAVEISRLYSAS